MGDNGLEAYREQIDEIDRAIFAAFNRRLELVGELRRYKDEHGLAFVDPGREAAMVEERLRENPGPLSERGLRALQRELLALTKSELVQGESSSSSPGSSSTGSTSTSAKSSADT
ncbi:MAG: chorismate mutase [Gaiellaceae bacterium]